jgi:hypothetical protein
MVVDRRLSYGDARPPVEDAVKVMVLEADDGFAFVGYAGLGATALGTQPSAWMSAVLRGRRGYTLEQMLGLLAGVSRNELPQHLRDLPSRTHSIHAAGFSRDVGACLYGIHNIVDEQKGFGFEFTRYTHSPEMGGTSRRLAAGGTGSDYLITKPESWSRALLSLANAHDGNRVSAEAVADHLAAINYETHLAVKDGSVGPRCIVMWRHRPEAKPSQQGNGFRCYDGTDFVGGPVDIPTIAGHYDVSAIIRAMAPFLQPTDAVNAWLNDPNADPGDFVWDLDEDAINRALAELPDGPDETLR